MKQFKILLTIFLLSIFTLPIIANAESGKITISSTSTIVVGNKVTVTVKLSAGSSWEMNLNYDKNYLQLVSSTGESNGTRMVNTSIGKPNRTYTFTFKTLKSGSTTIKVGSYHVIDDKYQDVTITSSSKTIKIITQAELQASYSKDNNLKSLKVDDYELTPAFAKDITSYEVIVPEGTSSVKVSATANDNKASVDGDGTIAVSEGINNVTISVRAENGSEKKYNLVINVIDQNPIEIYIDNEKYTVIKLRKNYSCPELFEESEITIGSFTIPACYNEKINYTLVGLKKENGEVDDYIYDQLREKYTKYLEIIGTSLKLIALDFDGELEGLVKDKKLIGEKEYTVFKFSNKSKSYVIYGQNVETGKKDFYLYDTINNTFGRYDSEHIDYLKELNKTYIYVIIAFGIGLFLSFICIISLSSSKKKIKKRLLQEKQNNLEYSREKDNSNVIEEIANKEEQNNEEYELFEDKKSKKKQKRTKKE